MFGKQTDSTGVYTKIWVAVKLPETGRLSCLSETQRKLIKTVVYSKVNDENITKVPNIYWAKEKDAMDYLTKRIIKAVDCCDLPYRESCSTCLGDDEIEFLLTNDGFFERNISIVSQDYNAPPGHLNIHGLLNYKLQIGSDDFIPFEEMVKYDSLMQTYGLTFEGFITDNYSTCSEEFDNIDSMFSNTTADVKVWWNVSSTGKLWEKNDVFKLGEKLGNTFIDGLEEFQDIDNIECHGTKRYAQPKYLNTSDFSPYTIGDGILAHYIIETYYLKFGKSINANVEVEYMIPQASTKVPYNVGYADIVNLTSREIFEIKTVRSANAGVKEVELYIEKANKFCDTSTGKFWKGKSYPHNLSFPWPVPGVKFITYLHDNGKAKEGGVITYKLDKKPLQPEPQPYTVAIPESYWKKAAKLIEDLIKSSFNTQLILDFQNNNSDDIIRNVVIICVGVVGGAAIVTLLSSGTSSMGTIPTMMAASLIIAILVD